MRNLTELTGAELKARTEVIRYELMTRKISYDEAKAKAQPIIDEMNKRGFEIAKKYKKRYYGVKFAALMR